MVRNAKVLLLAAAILVILVLAFAWRNLRGIGPAVFAPPANIADQIDRAPGAQNATEFPLSIPEDFRVSVYARDLGAVRVLLPDGRGTVLASIPEDGRIVSLPDENADGRADRIDTLISGLNRPHGLACKWEGEKCRLYVAETDAIRVYDYDPATRTASGGTKILDLPTGGRHWTKTLLIKDDQLLISSGSSCDVCREEDERRGAVLVSNLDGSNLRVYARGLRNSVFLTTHPESGAVWATEMGRDFLGDDLPPDEVNIVEGGKNYGWPICYGKNIHDTVFDKNTYIRNPCMEPFETPSRVDLPAHSAPLGIAFIPESWPEEMRGDLLVAFHGSWNRTQPTGYKITRLKLTQDDQFTGMEDLVSGWLTSQGALGRPVDLVFSGNILYVSDDKAGVIYRVNPL